MALFFDLGPTIGKRCMYSYQGDFFAYGRASTVVAHMTPHHCIFTGTDVMCPANSSDWDTTARQGIAESIGPRELPVAASLTAKPSNAPSGRIATRNLFACHAAASNSPAAGLNPWDSRARGAACRDVALHRPPNRKGAGCSPPMLLPPQHGPKGSRGTGAVPSPRWPLATFTPRRRS